MRDIPIFDANDPDLGKRLEVALSDKSIVTQINRPYAGQPQMNTGERGREEVHDVTMRDVYDCVIIGIVQATPYSNEEIMQHLGDGTRCLIENCERPKCKLERGELQHDDVYKSGSLAEADPIAIAQRICVALRERMEKRMEQ